MHKRNLLIIAFFCFIGKMSMAQNREAVRLYIATYKELAIEEMKRTGVPAAIKLAQGIHETDAGNSILVKKSNNHFGIKCKTGWQGQSVKHTDDARNECFRKYNSSTDSYLDHSNFLKGSSRYASLFELDPTDYAGWAYGLKKAGYATNPKYSQVLIRLIEEYHLQEYTLIALGNPLPEDGILVSARQENILIETEPVFAEMKTNASGKNGNHEQKIIQEINVEKVSEKPVYPQGDFKINDTRVVFVAKGTPYLSLALQYNLPLARIFEFNELPHTEAADKDRLIFIQRKRKTGNHEFHIVKSGETLHDIAQEQAIRLESLLEYNKLTRNMQPAIGEKLFLKNNAPMQPRLALKENYSISNFQNVRH